MAISCAVNLILIDHLKNNEVDVIQQTILGSRMEALELTNPASSYNKQGNLLLFHYVTILCMLKLSREREKQTERETERERQLYKTNPKCQVTLGLMKNFPFLYCYTKSLVYCMQL